MAELLVKGGILLDPAQGIQEKKDIAISDGKIEDTSGNISDASAQRVIDASGLFVTPGFVDLHAHVAYDVLRMCIDPQVNCLLKGTTTVVDAGSCGELNFLPFREYVTKKNLVRILAFLNVESLGMIEFVDSPIWNTDQKWARLLNSKESSKWFATPENTSRLIRQNRQTIVGIKWAHHTLELLKIARKTADDAACLVMAESRLLPDSLKYLKEGDIATHIFHFAKHRITKKHDGITEDGKTIRPEVFAAHRRGVVFDVGHGKGSFSWGVARLALKEGLEPDTISTDLWSGNVAGPVYDLPTTMAKFLHLGLGLEKVVSAVTSKPASVLGREKEFGTMTPGAPADLVMFKLQSKKKVLTDSYGKSEQANQVLLPIHVIKDGQLVGN
jgi:dihydroorotase